ncbi:hypothetical protein E3983_06260 [Legionella israelensis]|uniref:Uncharacterized protein n=1 Tax=Legionella israelensis TaxID=454 RepID=A0AAX1EFT8_9GAMM|nr:hypothetical protein [Legionella israelensis]QBR83988.1 hypothetical protein E3983_06260 [Legionella israelensis]
MSDVCTSLQSVERLGTIEQVNGLHYVASGPPQVFIGELCEITNHQHQPLMTAEVTGFNHGKVYLMPHSHRPVCMGYPVRAIGKALQIKVSSALLGRIVNAFCQPIDHQGLIKSGESVAIHRPPMSPLHRLPVSQESRYLMKDFGTSKSPKSTRQRAKCLGRERPVYGTFALNEQSVRLHQ